jgi:hypothetical protein
LQDRGQPDYEISVKEVTDNYTVYNIDFQSRNFLNYTTRIYGLLFVPISNSDVPGLVLLPGGSVSKEAEAHLASKIANMGYAALTIDQRGIGQTGGYYLWIQEDYEVFVQDEEPIQHLSVFDGLRAYDVLRNINGIEHDDIAIAGESMGGRYAIIAAAIDKRLKGVIAISSAGFHVPDTPVYPYTNYLLSIDPDHYIDKISPNKVFMLHGNNDTTININDAKITYNLAGEPKRFFTADGCGHGYCDVMYDELKEDLRLIFIK